MPLGEPPELLTPRPRKPQSPLARMLGRIRHSDEFPSISKYVVEINRKLAASSADCDASELADIILHDYGLTSKLLKLANSVNYAFASGNVTTVTRAVVVLGFKYVRMTAIGLSLFEHFKNNAFEQELKEEVIRSFWSGILARDLAAAEKDIDPEEAFLCAMLSRFGKLVMIRYLPGEYRKVLNWMARHDCSETIAVKACCGITYQELGRAVARQWNFPPRICDGLRPIAIHNWKHRDTGASKLAALSGFVQALSKLIGMDGQQKNEEAVQKLLEQFQPVVSISKKQLERLIEDSLAKVRQHARAMDFSVADSPFFNDLTAAFASAPEGSAAVSKPSAALPASGSFKLTDSMDLKTGGSDAAASPAEMILEGVQEISQAMMADHAFNDIAPMGLEILYRSLGVQRALMFIRDSDTQWMNVRFGYGRQARNLVQNAGFKVAEAAKDLFNLSLRVGKDLVMADAGDDKIRHLIPLWYRRHIDAPAFIFLPIMVQNVAIGALYADRPEIGAPINEAEHRHLSMLRNQLVLAIQYRQLHQDGAQPTH
ncbi:HDOD domain-containing protein [Desulfatitalea alkaliphila]|uniref:HDOD domain-containing protein n=1 Tax=Desulfatitalea alkaliphila TaxID=2929485 RepID=A0AA41R264_9BACT|nr:HDOD domain-containing protein [Desulfatitalea alkaliphila]MCJ8499475.1 HDOD domain-containing protein [Desulfatitalea alkaliphila]